MIVGMLVFVGVFVRILVGAVGVLVRVSVAVGVLVHSFQALDYDKFIEVFTRFGEVAKHARAAIGSARKARLAISEIPKGYVMEIEEFFPAIP